ncbi:MAG: hypothetical protein HY22_09085 [[Candidatus Thermochlorobacteriaceae] bacterium GBChlB]|nr:MAG: hypothetical protein HY22_09085 [[Candidatus Thermochlorobacteriaceae] bacterium GBChlB]
MPCNRESSNQTNATLKQKEGRNMKTSATVLSAEQPTLWYAAKPVAYQVREGYQKRMTLGLAVATAIYALSIGSYFISDMIQPKADIKPERSIVIGSEIIPAPPMTEVKKLDTPTEESGDGATDANIKTSAGRQQLSQSVENSVGSAINAALNSGVFAEMNGGLPMPTEGATESSILNGTTNIGLRNLGTGEQLGTSLGNAGENLSFGMSNSGNAINASLSRNGLTGNTTSGLNVARTGKLMLNENMIARGVTAGGRSAEEILAVVKSNQKAVMDAYNAARMASGGSLKGSMTVKLVIRPDGAVGDVQVVKTTFTSDNFKRDILAKVRRMKFSAIAAQADQAVIVPFDFTDEN